VNHEIRLHDEYKVLPNVEGKCLEPSDLFCRLVGCDRFQLLGKRIDAVTAPNMINVPKNLRVVLHFGLSQGLWMLLHREDAQILARYESELLPDMSIEMRMEPIGGGYEGVSGVRGNAIGLDVCVTLGQTLGLVSLVSV
jgi:hypothetical protein